MKTQIKPTKGKTTKRSGGTGRKLDPAQEAARLMQNAALLSRAALAGNAGKQFGGDRDLFNAFGYLTEPAYDDYRATFDRDGLATQAVEKFSNATWAKGATLVDDDERSDDGDLTSPFLTAWNEMTDRLGLWQVIREADVLSGIGRFSLLHIGLPGDFSKPASKAARIYYLAAYPEDQVIIREVEKSATSERYGLPTLYQITPSQEDQELLGARTRDYHWTRIMHIAENKLGSRIYGRPRLQTVINRLFDLEKVTGGSAEAVWLLVFKGLAIIAREGVEMPGPGSTELTSLNDEIEKYVHGLQRVMKLSGVDVESLGTETVDAMPTYQMLISYIAGSLEIPQRILIGSERGELASTQDKDAWQSVIRNRQKTFAEPSILRPFIDKCISLGALPAPRRDKYEVEWPPLFEPTPKEKVEIANLMAAGASQITNGVSEDAMSIDEWRQEANMPPLPDEYIDEREDEKEEAQQDQIALLAAKSKAAPAGGDDEETPTVATKNRLAKLIRSMRR